MDNQTAVKIYRQCRERFGEMRQKNKSTEEVGEYLQALNRYYEGEYQYDTVIEEVADCIVCFEQVLLAIGDRHGISFEEIKQKVIDIKNKKILRLEKRIQK